MKDTSRNRVDLHPIIDRTISRVEMHEHNVEFCMDILEWRDADKATVEFSEDESAFNQNFIGKRQIDDDDYEDYIRQELRYHKEEMENQRILLRCFMEAFNGGWLF